MERLKNLYNKSSEWFLNQAKRKYFDEIYSAIIIAIALFSWAVSGIVGLTILVILALIAVILTFDLKYIVPHVIYILFTLSSSLTLDLSIPIFFYVLAGLLIICVIACNIKNKFTVKKFNFALGLIGLAITSIIPIFWAQISAEYGFYYAMYFADLGYLLLYLLMSNGTKSNSLNITITAISLLPYLLASESIIMVIKYWDNIESVFDMWYSYGWGLCNEAGIMCCVAMPFIAYKLIKAKSYKNLIYNLTKMIFAGICILLTTSRASYAFGCVEMIAMLILPLFLAEDKKKYRKFFLITMATVAACAIICIVPLINAIKGVTSSTFSTGTDSNGRMDLWKTGIEKWTENYRNVIFGPGFCCDIALHHYCYDFSYNFEMETFTVFHSTILETLATGGVIGLGFLACHLYEKYTGFFKIDKAFGIIMTVGFAFVEGYGLIDNTYHMYFFMIPFVVALAAIDNHIYLNKNACECERAHTQEELNDEGTIQNTI